MKNLDSLSVLVLALIVPLALGGCGDDGGTTTDGGMDSGGDAGDTGGGDVGPVDCSTSDDGTTCGGNLICIGGSCQPTICGDGYTDADAGEECDDGNSVPGDGCEPDSCVLTCSEDSHCADEDPCNGAEVCNLGSNRCQAGTPAPGAPCVRDDGSDGVCSGVLCAAPGCGNGAVDGMEDCDDGANGDNADGCRDDCSFTCDEEMGCDDGDMCNGGETCELASHTCTAGTDLDCDDSDTCTADSCDGATGCVNDLIDGDSDGYAAGTCTTAGLMGGDCNDSSAAQYPGAPEGCDGIDNDCNGMVDDGTVDIDCQRDLDGDGYGNALDVMTACTCPAGYIPPHPSGDSDCDDTNASVNPDVTAYSVSFYCPGGGACDSTTGSYDWDCSGSEERQYPTLSWGGCGRDPSCSGLCAICTGTGWTTSTVPECGQPSRGLFLNNFRSCSFGGGFICSESFSRRRQGCR